MVRLVKLNHEAIQGIYGKDGKQFAKRMSFLHPDAAIAFWLLPDITLSDMWRSASASHARWTKNPRIAKPPAYSAHNFGLAIDVAVTQTLEELGLTKPELDEIMRTHGWWCHRMDGKRRAEEWHYNYLGQDHEQPKNESRTAAAVERKIKAMYEHQWLAMDTSDVQRALSERGLYSGEVDGLIGQQTINAVRNFQQMWTLKPDGVAGPKTCRLLWFVDWSAPFSSR